MDAWIEKKPLDLGSDLKAETAAARHAAGILKSADPRRASAAAAYVQDLLDRTLSTHVTGPVACAKGCNLCCHTFVSATIPEIFRLAELVRSNPLADTGAIIAAARDAKAIGQDRRFTTRVSCPLLKDGLCGAYAARPLACRTMLSRSLAACTAYFPVDGAGTLDYAPGARESRGRVEMILAAALNLAGLPGKHVELIQGLAVALTVENAEARWLAGEDIFADVERDSGDASSDLATWGPILARQASLSPSSL